MFEVTLEQNIFAKALKLLAYTVGDNSKGFNDDCISMELSPDLSKLIMYTTDTNSFTKCDIPVSLCKSTTPDKAPYVPFKRLKKIVESVPESEPITLKENNNGDLQVKYQLKNGTTIISTKGSYLQLPSVNEKEICVKTNFLKYSAQSAWKIIDSSDATNAPIYQCMRIATSNLLDVEVTALDHKLSRAYYNKDKTTISNPSQEIIIQANVLHNAMSMFDGYDDMLLSTDGNIIKVEPDISSKQTVPDNHIANNIFNVELYSRVINGNFMNNISSYFGAGPAQYAEIDFQEFKTAFERAKAIQDDFVGNRSVNIEVTDNKAKMSYSSLYGELNEEINLSYSISNGINNYFLYDSFLDILGGFDKDTKNIYIGKINNAPNNIILKGVHMPNEMFMISSTQANANKNTTQSTP